MRDWGDFSSALFSDVLRDDRNKRMRGEVMFSDASPVRGAIIRYGSWSGRVLSLTTTTTTTTRFYYVKKKNIKEPSVVIPIKDMTLHK